MMPLVVDWAELLLICTIPLWIVFTGAWRRVECTTLADNSLNERRPDGSGGGHSERHVESVPIAT